MAPALTVTTGWLARASRSALMSPVSRRPGGHPRCRRSRTRRCRRRRRAPPMPRPWSPRTPIPGRPRPARHARRPCVRAEDPRVLVRVETDTSDAVEHRRHGRHRARPRGWRPRQRSSACALAGDGRPRLEKIVDSNATTGRPSATTRATSSESTGCNTRSVCPRPVAQREPRDRLDVVRAGEEVDHVGPLVPVAELSEQQHRRERGRPDRSSRARAPAIRWQRAHGCRACRVRCGRDRRSRRRTSRRASDAIRRPAVVRSRARRSLRLTLQSATADRELSTATT